MNSITENPLKPDVAPKWRGPSLWRFLRMFHGQNYDIFRLAVQLQREYGDLVSLPLAIPSYMVSNPADLRHVLVGNPDNYLKIGALVVAKQLLGEGLVTSEGPLHHRNRRAMQPMFHRQKIQSFAETMIERTQARMAKWVDGEVVNIADEVTHITLSIISLTLFSIDLDHQAKELSDAIAVGQDYFADSVTQIKLPILATIQHRRFLRAVDKINGALGIIIRERLQPNAPPKDDLLGMLIEMRFEDGGAMDEKALRDEIMTLFVAGHETTSAVLTWTLKLLSENPDVEAAFHQELKTVLQGRPPTLSDIPQLRLTEKIINESMRLYPPVWLMARYIIADDQLPSGLGVKKGGQILMLNYAAHRNPTFFPDPERFLPSRFDEKIGLAQSYTPFGAGIRSCVGEPFARMELVLVLAAICQQFRFRTFGKPTFKRKPLIIMRPKDGIPMQVTRRS